MRKAVIATAVLAMFFVASGVLGLQPALAQDNTETSNDSSVIPLAGPPPEFQLRWISCTTPVFDSPGGSPVGDNALLAGQTWFVGPRVFFMTSSGAFEPADEQNSQNAFGTTSQNPFGTTASTMGAGVVDKTQPDLTQSGTGDLSQQGQQSQDLDQTGATTTSGVSQGSTFLSTAQLLGGWAEVYVSGQNRVYVPASCVQ